MRRDSLEDRVEKLEKEFRHINEFDGEVSADLDHILFRLARLEDFTGINEAIDKHDLNRTRQQIVVLAEALNRAAKALESYR